MAQMDGFGLYRILPTSKSKSSGDLFVKLLSIIAFILIILALSIIARTPHADGYEISIYEAYPRNFWYFLILSAACGVGILIHQAFVTEKSKLWAAGILIFIITNIIIILLPIFRGYFISSTGDEITHLGNIKDIDLTGHVGFYNVYPISHILSYEISSIGGLDSRFVIKIISSIFYLIYIAGLYLLAKVICRDFGQVLLVMAFGSGLIFTYFNYLFLPTQLFLYLIPFVLFLSFKKNSSTSLSKPTILVILLIMMPFLHPLGSVFLVAIFLLLALSIEIFNVLTKKLNSRGETAFYSSEMALKPGAIVLIIFLSWFLTFAIFRSTLRKAYEWFVIGYGTPEVTNMAETFEMSGLSILQLANLIIMTYGPSLIFSFISFVAIYTIFRRIFSQRSCLKVYEIFFPLLFLAFCVFYISTLLGDFLGTGSSQRIFCWALVASTIINGLVFHELIISFRNKFNVRKSNIVCVGLLAVIVITVILGMFSVYPSPYIMKGNFQVTTMDWAGMTWFFNHKNNDDTISFNQLPWRAPHYLYGKNNLYYEREFMGDYIEVPQNLGYNEHESLANSIGSDCYIVINDQVRVSKEQLWPYVGRYTIDDLNRMSHDSRVIKVYSNGELDIFRVFAFEI